MVAVALSRISSRLPYETILLLHHLPIGEGGSTSWRKEDLKEAWLARDHAVLFGGQYHSCRILSRLFLGSSFVPLESLAHD